MARKAKAAVSAEKPLEQMELGEVIDTLYLARAARLDKQHELEALEKREGEIKKYLLDNIEKQKLDGAFGKIATASVSRLTVPTWKQGDDHAFENFCKYVKDNDAFDLFERRVAKTAYRERLEQGVAVPGLEPYEVLNISLTKRGGK